MGSFTTAFRIQGLDLKAKVYLSNWIRRDLDWWKVTLIVENGGKIPNPDGRYKLTALKMYTDAAGGSMDWPQRDVGMVIFPNIWSQLLHGPNTNTGSLSADGKSLACKLSFWELVGPLLAITCAPEKVRNK